MADFCSNCGAEMGIRDKFCPSCGTEIGAQPSVQPSAIGHWQAKQIDTDEGGSSRKGTLSLTKDSLVFFVYGFFSKEPKERRRIAISSIKSIIRTPIFNMFTVRYNKASAGAGALRRFVGMRSASYKIKNWESFIQNIRVLNPNIKIKV